MHIILIIFLIFIIICIFTITICQTYFYSEIVSKNLILAQNENAVAKLKVPTNINTGLYRSLITDRQRKLLDHSIMLIANSCILAILGLGGINSLIKLKSGINVAKESLKWTSNLIYKSMDKIFEKSGLKSSTKFAKLSSLATKFKDIVIKKFISPIAKKVITAAKYAKGGFIYLLKLALKPFIAFISLVAKTALGKLAIKIAEKAAIKASAIAASKAVQVGVPIIGWLDLAISLANIATDVADPRGYNKTMDMATVNELNQESAKAFEDGLKEQKLESPIIIGPLDQYSADQITKTINYITSEVLTDPICQSIYLGFLSNGCLTAALQTLIAKYVPKLTDPNSPNFDQSVTDNYNKMLSVLENDTECISDVCLQSIENFSQDILLAAEANNDNTFLDAVNNCLSAEIASSDSKIIDYLQKKISSILCGFPDIVYIISNCSDNCSPGLIAFDILGNVVSVNNTAFPAPNAGNQITITDSHIIYPTVSTDNVNNTYCSFSKKDCSLPKNNNENEWAQIKEYLLKKIADDKYPTNTDLEAKLAGYTEFTYFKNSSGTYGKLYGDVYTGKTEGYCHLAAPSTRIICEDSGVPYNESEGTCYIDERYCKKMGQTWKKNEKGTYDCILETSQLLAEAASGTTLLREGNASHDDSFLEACKQDEIKSDLYCMKCPKDHPNFNSVSKTCWSEIPVGYDLQPGTVNCYPKCPSDMKDLGLSCDANTYYRGTGTSPYNVGSSSVCSLPYSVDGSSITTENCNKYCKSPSNGTSYPYDSSYGWEKWGLSCMPKCKPGYFMSSAGTCQKSCPEGFTTTAGLCMKNMYPNCISSVNPTIRKRRNIIGVGLPNKNQPNFLFNGVQISATDQTAQVCNYTEPLPSELPNNILNKKCWANYSTGIDGSCNNNNIKLNGKCWYEYDYTST